MPKAKMKIRTEQVIDVDEWDKLVTRTYGRPYKFQQQDGCRGRGTIRFSVPDEAEDIDRDTVPEEVNHEEMGVSFKAWLARDPEQIITDEVTTEHGGVLAETMTDLWWARNFYPDFQTVANDLHAKGLLEAGKYSINIDW